MALTCIEVFVETKNCLTECALIHEMAKFPTNGLVIFAVVFYPRKCDQMFLCRLTNQYSLLDSANYVQICKNSPMKILDLSPRLIFFFKAILTGIFLRLYGFPMKWRTVGIEYVALVYSLMNEFL